MKLEITPEPSPEERAAIERTLERDLRELMQPPAYRSLWRAVGVRENTDRRA